MESSLASHENLFHAIGRYLDENAVVQSSPLISELIAGIGECTTLSDVFTFPIVRGTFSYDGALAWLMFVHCAPAVAVEEGDAPFPSGEFTADGALKKIGEIYDRAIDENVLGYFDEDESSGSESEDYSEDDDEDETAPHADAHVELNA